MLFRSVSQSRYKVIDKYLTDPTYKSNMESPGKFKVIDDSAFYEKVLICNIDREEKTICFFNNDKFKGWSKGIQTMLKKQAIELGYTEEN